MVLVLVLILLVIILLDVVSVAAGGGCGCDCNCGSILDIYIVLVELINTSSLVPLARINTIRIQDKLKYCTCCQPQNMKHATAKTL